MGEVVTKITEYADRFISLPLDSVGVIVTNMDKHREWTEKEFTAECIKSLEIKDVVFTSIDKSGYDLLQDILDICCPKPYDLKVDGEKFLRMFKFNDSKRKIVGVTSEIKDRFITYKDQFDLELKNYSEKERVDLFFEFKAFIMLEVEAAKKEMSEKLGFDFMGEDKFLQAGHLANMVNQIRGVIYDVRMESLQYQSNHGASNLRKCPHCGMVWAKVEGCEGQTKCGSMPSTHYDVRPDFVRMATFTFNIVRGKLTISRHGERSIADKKEQTGVAGSVGCGQSINWRDMKRVEVDFLNLEDGDINTEDVLSVPETTSGKMVLIYINRALEKLNLKSEKVTKSPVKRKGKKFGK